MAESVQILTPNVHDCAFDTCVLVIKPLTLLVSLHGSHSQHPLSLDTESVSQPPPGFMTHIIMTELGALGRYGITILKTHHVLACIMPGLSAVHGRGNGKGPCIRCVPTDSSFQRY